jgi:hypothetical protein
VVDCELGVSKCGGRSHRVLTRPFVVCPFELEIRPVLRSLQGSLFGVKPSGGDEAGDISTQFVNTSRTSAMD